MTHIEHIDAPRIQNRRVYSQQRIIVMDSYKCKGKIQNSFLMIRHSLDFNKENRRHLKEPRVIPCSFSLSLLASATLNNWNAQTHRESKKGDKKEWLLCLAKKKIFSMVNSCLKNNSLISLEYNFLSSIEFKERYSYKKLFCISTSAWFTCKFF